MGNLCTTNERRQNIIQRAKLVQKYEYSQIEFLLMMGDIFDEESDAIINASEAPFHQNASPVLRRAGTKLQSLVSGKELQAGKAIYTDAGLLSSRYIIHAVLPTWTGGSNGGHNELAKVIETYYECFRVASELNVKTISFCDFNNIIMQIPKNFNADAFETSIREIQIVNTDSSIIGVYKYELQKKLDAFQDPNIRTMIQERESLIQNTFEESSIYSRQKSTNFKAIESNTTNSSGNQYTDPDEQSTNATISKQMKPIPEEGGEENKSNLTQNVQNYDYNQNIPGSDLDYSKKGQSVSRNVLFDNLDAVNLHSESHEDEHIASLQCQESKLPELNKVHHLSEPIKVEDIHQVHIQSGNQQHNQQVQKQHIENNQKQHIDDENNNNAKLGDGLQNHEQKKEGGYEDEEVLESDGEQQIIIEKLDESFIENSHTLNENKNNEFLVNNNDAAPQDNKLEANETAKHENQHDQANHEDQINRPSGTADELINNTNISNNEDNL